jgi:hypothetical protein
MITYKLRESKLAPVEGRISSDELVLPFQAVC